MRRSPRSVIFRSTDCLAQLNRSIEPYDTQRESGALFASIGLRQSDAPFGNNFGLRSGSKSSPRNIQTIRSKRTDADARLKRSPEEMLAVSVTRPRRKIECARYHDLPEYHDLDSLSTSEYETLSPVDSEDEALACKKRRLQGNFRQDFLHHATREPLRIDVSLRTTGRVSVVSLCESQSSVDSGVTMGDVTPIECSSATNQACTISLTEPSSAKTLSCAIGQTQQPLQAVTAGSSRVLRNRTKSVSLSSSQSLASSTGFKLATTRGTTQPINKDSPRRLQHSLREMSLCDYPRDSGSSASHSFHLGCSGSQPLVLKPLNIRITKPTFTFPDDEDSLMPPVARKPSQMERIRTHGESCERSLGESSDSGVVSDDQTEKASACRWRRCKHTIQPVDLLEHIERVHVVPQKRGSKVVYRCYWEGCKVYGKVAKSYKWLEGHVTKHLGSKPYHCIFPQCAHRFSSQELLQKHVDAHITSPKSPKAPPTPAKSARRNVKRLKGTQCCLPKTEDYFAPHILESVVWRQQRIQEKWGHLLTDSKDGLKFQSAVVGMTRSEADGGSTDMLLLRWIPEDFQLPDTWCPKRDYDTLGHKVVPLAHLHRNVLLRL